MHYHFKVYDAPGGYLAVGIDLPDCQTRADTLHQLKLQLRVALNAFLSEPEGARLVFPLPQKQLQTQNVVRVPVEARIAFALLLRQTRLGLRMTQKQAAARAEIPNLTSYQRLESAQTANPSLDTLVKLKRAFPSLKIDDVLTDW